MAQVAPLAHGSAPSPEARSGFTALIAPARPEQVRHARLLAYETARRAGLGIEACSDVALAVSEICANTVLHAYRDGEPGTFELRTTIVDGGLEVSIVDRGCGLSPRPDSPGAGFGIPIVAALTSSLVMRSRPEGGTEVRMSFGPQATL